MKAYGLTKKLAILSLAIMAGSLLFYAPCGLEAEESITGFTGKIVKIMGEVKIKRSGENDWIGAKHGMEIGVEDRIVTGIDSSADILFVRNKERSKIRILEEADMSLLTLDLDKVTGDSEILLDLAIGHIIIKTDPLKGKSRFEVLTPTSMTAVRGTGFEIKVSRREEGPVVNGNIAQ
ncbi:MAG: FecR domain-containing protein [Candidatus Omnitrophota bacterium]